MHRVLKEELDNFLATQNIPKVKAFKDVEKGRFQMFENSVWEALKVDGLFLEFGVLTGGTINQISSLIPNKIVYGFDSFKGLPENYTDVYRKGSMKHIIPKVNPNVKLIIGWFEDTLNPFLNEHKEKVAFIHMDADVYSSTYYVLETLIKANRLQIGTVIQFDEIFEIEGKYWYQDEFKAWNEIIKKYKIKTDYLCWAGFCHCAYIIKNV